MQCGAQTLDSEIKNLMLYQLSWARKTLLIGEAPIGVPLYLHFQIEVLLPSLY